MHWSASQARSSSRLVPYHPSISSIGRLKVGQMWGSLQKKRVLMHQALPRAAQPAALWGTEAGADAADQQRSQAGAAVAQGRPAAAPHGAAVNQHRAPPRGTSGAVRPLRAGDAPGGRRGRPTGRGRPFWFSQPPGMPCIPHDDAFLGPGASWRVAGPHRCNCPRWVFRIRLLAVQYFGLSALTRSEQGSFAAYGVCHALNYP